MVSEVLRSCGIVMMSCCCLVLVVFRGYETLGAAHGTLLGIQHPLAEHADSSKSLLPFPSTNTGY